MEINQLVSIIIVNWNGKPLLSRCLSSLVGQQYRKIEIILVDNASKDNSVSYIKRNFPQVKVVINKRNVGFAQANNVGYEHATGEYILFLNNDTEVTPTFLQELVGVMEKEKTIAGVQSKIFFMDDKKRLDTVGSFPTSTGFLYHYGFAKKDSKIYNRQIDIYSAKGACMLFRRNILEKIKVEDELFDSRYFAYFEETDLCHRVWLSGQKIVFVPTSVIYHKIGATSSKLDNAFIQYHSFKNRINSYLKNLGSTTLIKILMVHLILCVATSIIYLLRRKIGISWAINRAILWNIVNFWPTLKKRHFIQSRIRKISDAAFLPTLSKNVRPTYYWYAFWGSLVSYKKEEIWR